MQKRKIRKALQSLSVLSSAVILTACETTPALPDESRFACLEEPGRPIGSGAAYTLPDGRLVREVTDEEAGRYMVDLRAAGQDCRSKLAWLRDYFRPKPAR